MLKKQKIYNKLLLIFISFIVILCIFILLLDRNRLGDYSVEIVSPTEKIVQPLLKDQEINVEGYTGIVIVQIKNQSVKVLSSTCPDKVCVKAGAITKPGPIIICAPNRVMVRIVSRRLKPLVTY